MTATNPAYEAACAIADAQIAIRILTEGTAADADPAALLAQAAASLESARLALAGGR